MTRVLRIVAISVLLLALFGLGAGLLLPGG
jgi:hypothetical protein